MRVCACVCVSVLAHTTQHSPVRRRGKVGGEGSDTNTGCDIHLLLDCYAEHTLLRRMEYIIYSMNQPDHTEEHTQTQEQHTEEQTQTQEHTRRRYTDGHTCAD